jgi:hypothetical protein
VSLALAKREALVSSIRLLDGAPALTSVAVRKPDVKADRSPIVTPALGVDEASEVANGVDPPTRGPDASFELTALVPPQHQTLSSLALPKHHLDARPIHRIDHETDKGTSRLVG